MGIEIPNIEPQTKELEKAKILAGVSKEIFGITGFEKNDYSFLKNSPEEISKLCNKYNMSEQFKNICNNNLGLDLKIA